MTDEKEPTDLELAVSEGYKIDRELLSISQAKALTSISNNFDHLVEFLTQGGLIAVLEGYSRSQGVNALLNGLLAAEGRKGLDAKNLKQNALEIVEALESVFDKYEEKLGSKLKRDPELKDAEKDFKKDNSQEG